MHKKNKEIANGLHFSGVAGCGSGIIDDLSLILLSSA